MNDDEIIDKLFEELKLDEIFGFFVLDDDTSLLDGNFTSVELRKLADAMDELKRRRGGDETE